MYENESKFILEDVLGCWLSQKWVTFITFPQACSQILFFVKVYFFRFTWAEEHEMNFSLHLPNVRVPAALYRWLATVLTPGTMEWMLCMLPMIDPDRKPDSMWMYCSVEEAALAWAVRPVEMVPGMLCSSHRSHGASVPREAALVGTEAVGELAVLILLWTQNCSGN